MKSYCFKLADGSGWKFMRTSSDTGVSLFVDKFATIAGLRVSSENGFRRIFFLNPDEILRIKESSCICDNRPVPKPSKDKWVVYDHKHLKIWCHEDIPDVYCEVCDNKNHDTEIMNMWHALQPIYQHVQKSGGLPIHGALLEIEGKGIIIAAPGNTGKSTCCRRLPGYWKPLCDDELLVVFDKGSGYRAHPFPTWSDYLWRKSEKKWNVEYSAPLKAIFFLEQAETDKAIVTGNGQAAILINGSATQVCRKFWRNIDNGHRRELTQQIFNNACNMAKIIPVYTLKATLTGSFWKEIERCIGNS